MADEDDTSATPPRRGRPPYEPNREQRSMVQVLSAHGVAQRIIAKSLGIDTGTLRRAFKEELRHGFDYVKAAMGAAVVKAGLGGNVTAQRYWLSCWGGPEWRVPAGADPNAPAPDAHSGNTTIIIKGGLPPVVYHEEEDPETAMVNLVKANGHGTNGSGRQT